MANGSGCPGGVDSQATEPLPSPTCRLSLVGDPSPALTHPARVCRVPPRKPGRPSASWACVPVGGGAQGGTVGSAGPEGAGAVSGGATSRSSAVGQEVGKVRRGGCGRVSWAPRVAGQSRAQGREGGGGAQEARPAAPAPGPFGARARRAVSGEATAVLVAGWPGAGPAGSLRPGSEGASQASEPEPLQKGLHACSQAARALPFCVGGGDFHCEGVCGGVRESALSLGERSHGWQRAPPFAPRLLGGGQRRDACCLSARLGNLLSVRPGNQLVHHTLLFFFFFNVKVSLFIF